VHATDYQLIAGHLYKLGAYGILIRCVMEHECSMVLEKAHEGIDGGNYAINLAIEKVQCVGLWWFAVHKDAKEYC
jgi:hypothetical protein